MALEIQRQRRLARLNALSAATKLGDSASSSNTIVQEYLNNCRSFYSCIYCRTHLANHDELVSRSFQGNRSRAYLFNAVVNIACGPPVQRELNTGSHAVADIYCTNCGTTIGWKYEKAYVDSQKYKEGKYIIELAHVVRENRHLELDKRDMFLDLLGRNQQSVVNQPSYCNSSVTPTIGTQHQGSLSPPSGGCVGGGGGGGGGHWSASSSSSSPSGSSTSSSSAVSPHSNTTNFAYDHRIDTTRQRYNSCGSNYATALDDDEDHDIDIDHEEVLMFPFYDDLYGNRSSYSNLSTSLSCFQRHLRRSLHNADRPSASYDWKCGGGGSSSGNESNPGCGRSRTISASCTSSPASAAVVSSRVSALPLEPQPRASTSASSIDIPTTSAGSQVTIQQRPSELSSDEDDERVGTDKSNTIATEADTQFEFEHELGRSAMLAVSNDDDDDDDDDGSKEHQPPTERQNCDPSEQSNSISAATLAARAIESIPSNKSSSCNSNSSNINNNNYNNNSTTTTGNLSVDDEEFYDCCTDHDVS